MPPRSKASLSPYPYAYVSVRATAATATTSKTAVYPWSWSSRKLVIATAGQCSDQCSGQYRVRMLPASTTRLRFREMTEADLPDIATLELGGTRGPAGWIEWTRQNYAQHGFGLWVIETHVGVFVGDCGLTMQKVEGEWHVEMGWHVRSALRRRGYASEAAAAVRARAEAAGIDHLIAIIRPDNLASQQVARRTGLVLEREVQKNGGPALVFGADLQS